MTKVPVLEPQVHEMHSGTTPAANDAEALFKEARQRRRRRRIAAFAGNVLLVAIVVGSVLAAGDSSNGPRSAATRHQGPLHATGQSKQRTQTAAPIPVYPPAQKIGVADSELDWVATGDSLDVTSDGGQSWQTITPPTLHGVTVSIDITTVAAIGTNDLWVGIYDVPGLVSQPNNGSSRGEGIEHSTDGGRSWSFVSPPGCLQTCGPLSLSMVDARERLCRRQRDARPRLPGLFDAGRRSDLEADCNHAQPRWRRCRWASDRIAAGLHQQSRRMGCSRDIPRV